MVHPFCQIDIIGAVMTVWRVRGKIVRSVLCSIVCNNSAQCSAHTWTDLLVVCWLDLAFLWLYCVLQFTCVRLSFLGLFCVCYSLFVYVCICCIRYSFFGTMPRDWLGRTSLKWPILYWVGHKSIMLIVRWCHYHPIISCFIKIQNGFTILVLAYQSCPEKEAVKWVFFFYSWYINEWFWWLMHHVIYLDNQQLPLC